MKPAFPWVLPLPPFPVGPRRLFRSIISYVFLWAAAFSLVRLEPSIAFSCRISHLALRPGGIDWSVVRRVAHSCQGDLKLVGDLKRTYYTVKMLLSRRACYKCGNIGHYAEVCSSSERLCYNCKQPGHESSSCPRPRTTETKQCYNCQGLGHVQADCPTLRLNGANGRCYNCSQPGHLARNCPAPASGAGAPAGRGVGAPRGGFNGGFRGGYGGYPRAATCYKCGGPNHFARDCQAQAMKCYACGKLGHISRDCTAPNGGPLSSAGKVCYKCAQAGHISRDCPNNEAAAQPTEANAAAAAQAAPAAAAVEATEAAPVAAAAPTTAVA